MIDIETYISSVSSIDEKDMVSKLFSKNCERKNEGFFPPFLIFILTKKSLKTSQGNKFQSQLSRFRDTLRFGSWIRRVKTGKRNFKDDRKCNLHDIGSHGSPG